MKVNEVAFFLKEALENNLTFIMPIKGTSMNPLLIDGDKVELTHPLNLKKGDIIFYRRENGEYILHRIYKVKKDSYYLLGDHQIKIEKNIKKEQIEAKVRKIIKIRNKQEKIIELTSFKYRFYKFLFSFMIVHYIYLFLKG